MMKTSIRTRLPSPLATLLLASALFASASGCASTKGDGRPPARHFAVDLSGLDWMEIVYNPQPKDPVFKMPCKISLMGSGEVEVRMGRSPRVWNSFSDKIEDASWNDYYMDHWHPGTDEMQKLFQRFVDEGLVLRSESHAMPSSVAFPNIRVRARIGREEVVRRTDDPRLVAIVDGILQHFEALARQSGSAAPAETAAKADAIAAAAVAADRPEPAPATNAAPAKTATKVDAPAAPAPAKTAPAKTAPASDKPSPAATAAAVDAIAATPVATAPTAADSSETVAQ